jgi:hypothetical protein
MFRRRKLRIEPSLSVPLKAGFSLLKVRQASRKLNKGSPSVNDDLWPRITADIAGTAVKELGLKSKLHASVSASRQCQ